MGLEMPSIPGPLGTHVKVTVMTPAPHNALDEFHGPSCLMENLTNSSYGQGLEAGGDSSREPRQSLTRLFLFKVLKDNLKLKTFVCASPIAVKTQLWIALITMSMLCVMQSRSKWCALTPTLVGLLSMNVLTHLDLWGWLDKPFAVSPNPLGPKYFGP